MKLRTPLLSLLGRVGGRGGRSAEPGVARAAVEALERRQMLAAAPPAGGAPEAWTAPSEVAVGHALGGTVASLTGVDAARFIAPPSFHSRPSRLPRAVIRWGDGRRTRVTATLAGADRIAAFVPAAKAHAYKKPGTYGVVVIFRHGRRVLGRVKAAVSVWDTPPDDVPPPPPVGTPFTTRFESQIREFEALDREQMPPRGGVVFVGSSSIREWSTLAEDFPGVPVINRGFGGSEVAEATYYASRIVLKYRPATIVLYAGENDLDRGLSPHQVLQDFKQFVQTVRSYLPKTRILFVSIKPSPSHESVADVQREANRLIRQYTQTDDSLVYVDMWPAMLGPDGKPRPELFRDGQHLSREGYAVWAEEIRPHL